MTPFKPLLSSKPDADDIKSIRFPILWSPKLDGIRTMITDIGPVSRKLKLIPNERLREALSHPDLVGFDGEMFYGPATAVDVFNKTQSAVMTIDGPCPYEADGRYLVFDDFTDPDAPFTERYQRMVRRIRQLPQKLQTIVFPVPHELVHTLDDLMNIERVVVSKGYEGVMGRDPEGRYKFGRSTVRDGLLFKIKRFDDAEAKVIGIEELMHNDNEKLRDELGNAKRSSHKENLRAAGTMGALILQSPDYAETFKIGTGFTAQQRADIWAMGDTVLGRTVCFKHQPSGAKDRPRFPSYKGFRKD